MGRNRKRVPKYQYLSKIQYFQLKNIPKQQPSEISPPEINAYHHATIITMNPFSKEGSFGFEKNKENESNDINIRKTIPITLNNSEKEIILNNTKDNLQSTNKSKKNQSPKLLPEECTVLTDRNKFSEQILSTQLQKKSFLDNFKHLTTKIIENRDRSIEAKTLEHNINNLKSNKPVESDFFQDNLEFQPSPHVSIHNPNIPIKLISKTTPNLKNETENKNLPNSNEHKKNSPSFQNSSHSKTSQSIELKNTNFDRKLTQQNNPKSKFEFHSKVSLLTNKTHDSPYIEEPNFDIQSPNNKSPNIEVSPKDRSPNTQNFNLQSSQNQSRPSQIDKTKEFKSQTNKKDVISNSKATPIINLQDSENKLTNKIKSISNLNLHSPQNSSNMLDRSFESSRRIFTDPSYPKTPSRFSPSHKEIIKSIEKASAILQDKAESVHDYIRSFDQKTLHTKESDFEMKSEILELKDALNLEKEKFEQITDEVNKLKSKEELWEARLMTYKNTCDSITEALMDIKSVQENLGEEIMRLNGLEQIYQNISELEREALQALVKEKDDESIQKLELEENYEKIKREFKDWKMMYSKEQETQGKLIENIKLLEEEIEELKMENYDGRREKNNLTPFASPPGSENKKSGIESFGNTPWNKSRLLDVLEGFFDSKVKNFNILLEKPL